MNVADIAAVRTTLLSGLGVAALLFGSPVLAGSGSYFVCVDDKGKKLFSQSPCPDSHQQLQERDYAVESNGVGLIENTGGERQLSKNNTLLKEMEANNRRLELNRKISQTSHRLDGLKADRDNRLSSMQTTLESIAGNNAHNRRAAVQQQIDSLSQSYDSKISRLESQLDDYNGELKRLLAALD